MEYQPIWKREEEMDKRREIRRNLLWAFLSITLGVVIFADTLKKLGENRTAQYQEQKADTNHDGYFGSTVTVYISSGGR